MDKDTRKVLQHLLDLHLLDMANSANLVTSEDRENIRLLVQIMTMDSLNRIATKLEDGQIEVINPNRD